MHFIGSIVYVCNDEYTVAEIEQFVIIDGQQRITTVMLLLMALYHYAKEHGDDRMSEMILEDYLINKRAEESFKVKLKATENNDRDLHYLLEGKPIPNGKYSNIKNNYNFFRNHISASNVNMIYEGFKRLLFVEIRLERGKDNAQKIFESLNSTGLDLSQADLIRNYILMGLEPSEQDRLYLKYWSEIETNTKVDGVSYVSDFIRDYLTIKQGEITKKDAVYSMFKKQYRIEDTLIEPILKELLNYSYIYQMLLKPEVVSDREIQKEIEYIRYIEINVSYPFLLQLIDDYRKGEITKDILVRILQFVQTFACRRFIIDLPTNALNKIFMNLYRQVDKDNYEESIYRHVLTRPGKNRMPSDIEIRNMLVNKDFYNARSRMKMYILERLENYNNKEFVPIIGNSDMTIEHIFPQTPDDKWIKELPEQEYNDFMNSYLHTLGNLTFSGNNGALGNKSFAEKKYMNKDGKEQGYVYSRLLLNRYLSEIEEWNVSNYKIRTDKLVKRFISIWKLPQIEGIQEIPEQNICDIDDPTNMQMEYAVFFGKRLEGDKYKGIKLYNHVVKELYKLQPEEFVESFSDLLHIKENPNDLRKPHALDNTYYYETNLSYLSIFRNLKVMLEKMELADELYIKFRNTTQTSLALDAVNESHPSESDQVDKKFKQLCVGKTSNYFGVELVKYSQSVYKSKDGQKGFYFSTSKIYSDARGEKYWFGYRKPAQLSDCKDVYYVFGCKDEETIVVLTQAQLDEKAWQMNYSVDEDTGEIRHWHVVFVKKKDGALVWSLSKPEMHEIDITKYLL